MKRQSSDKQGCCVPARAEFKLIRSFRPGVIRNGPGSIDPSNQRAALVPPGKSNPVVRMPGISLRKVFGIDVNPKVKYRAADPGTKLLAEVGQHVGLCVNDFPRR